MTWCVGRDGAPGPSPPRGEGRRSRDEGAFATTTEFAFAPAPPLPRSLHWLPRSLPSIPALTPPTVIPGLDPGIKPSAPQAGWPGQAVLTARWVAGSGPAMTNDRAEHQPQWRRGSDRMFHGLTSANAGVSRPVSPIYPRPLRPGVISPHRAAVERLATNEGGGGTGWWRGRSSSGGHCRLPWVSILHPGSGAADGP